LIEHLVRAEVLGEVGLFGSESDLGPGCIGVTCAESMSRKQLTSGAAASILPIS